MAKIRNNGDDVKIQFTQEISGAERTALDAIVAAHEITPEETGVHVQGNGVIYSKSNSSGVYWKFDGGNEVNLTVPNIGTTSAAASDTVTSSSSSYLDNKTTHITDDDDDEAIIRAIIAMGQTLKLKVIAEGVENHQQLVLLQSMGCDSYQGYYFSKPLNSHSFYEKYIQPAATQALKNRKHL